MDPLIISLSGVRGIIGKTLTPDILLKLAASFATLLKSGKVIVATDSRVSRTMCLDAVLSGIISSGCDAVNIGICPTPALQIAIESLKARGGICITASHNPPQWNGLKFYNSEATLLIPEEAKKLIYTFNHSKMVYARWDKLGKTSTEASAGSMHVNAVLKHFNLQLLKKKRFKVIIDCGNGAGAINTPSLLEKLGCETIKLNGEPNGLFNRPSEPIPGNLTGLCKTVAKEKADIGFAQDADADRLAIVSEKGKCLGEDYSLALAAQFVLKHNSGPVVTNVSTSKAVEDVAKDARCRFVETKVGEINVVRTMKKTDAIIGGEGNGGIILPAVHYGRDSLVGIGIVLQHMAETGMKISELVKTIPQYHMKKGKVAFAKGNTRRIFKKIRSSLKGAKFSFKDGMKIRWKNSWVSVRASGTEPIIRIIAEAPTKKEAETIYRSVASLVTE